MNFKYYLIETVTFTLILGLVPVSQGGDCMDDAVALDEKYLACCMGRPVYTSEICIDALLDNDTYSQECLVNCIYAQFELYNGESIDLAAVKTFLDNQIPDEDFNHMYMDAFQKCSHLDKEIIKNKFSSFKLKKLHDCDEYPSFVELCVWYHTIANCPEKYISNDETCYQKREWVKECLLKS